MAETMALLSGMSGSSRVLNTGAADWTNSIPIAVLHYMALPEIR